MRILHVTDAASAGVLTAVTTLARAQAAHPDIERVVLGYVPRPDSPTPAGIAELTGPAVEVRRWHRGLAQYAPGHLDLLAGIRITEHVEAIKLAVFQHSPTLPILI